jgi:hypothetical protein
MVMDALATVTYAGTKKNVVESGMVADTPAVAAPQKDGEPWKVTVVLEFPRDTDPFLKSTVKAAEAAILYHIKQLTPNTQHPTPRIILTIISDTCRTWNTSVLVQECISDAWATALCQKTVSTYC